MVSGTVASMATSIPTKVRENRLRDTATRQGLTLRKSRRRDPRARGYGLYMLVDSDQHTVVAGNPKVGYGLTLDEVEFFLTGEHA